MDNNLPCTVRNNLPNNNQSRNCICDKRVVNQRTNEMFIMSVTNIIAECSMVVPVKVFHHRGTEKVVVGHVRQWSLYPVTFDHNFDWEDFAVSIMREWLFYQANTGLTVYPKIYDWKEICRIYGISFIHRLCPRGLIHKTVLRVGAQSRCGYSRGD